MKKGYINFKKYFLVFGLLYITMLHVLVFVSCNDGGTYIIGDDPEIEDLRNFDGNWLMEELDDTDWDDIDEGLDDIYNILYNHWDDEDANNKLYDNTQDEDYYNPDNLKTYSDNDFIDILQVKVEDLNTEKAKMIVEVNGDADSSDKPWFLFIWTDCIGDGNDLVMCGVFIPGGLNEVDISYYTWEQSSDNKNGTIEFNEQGHEIEMEFDTENWENVDHCNIRAMMLTTDKEEYDSLDESNMVIDIFPGTKDQLLDWWVILLILLIIIIIVVVVYFIIKLRDRRKPSKINQPRIKSY